MPIVLGMFGLIALAVALRGNVSTVWGMGVRVIETGRALISWVVLIVVISTIGQAFDAPKAATAFIWLTVVAFVLRNSSQLVSGFNALASIAAPVTDALAVGAAKTTQGN